jgi:hypothetical protein
MLLIDARTKKGVRTLTRCPRAFGSMLIVLVAACSGESREGPLTTFTEQEGVTIAQTVLDGELPYCDAEEEVLRIGSPGGDDATALFRLIAARKLSDGRIALLNAGSSEVKVFSSSGEPELQFGRRGDGPGEFRNVWSLQVLEGDTLVIGNYRPWQFTFFTASGEFVRAVEMRPIVIERPESAVALPGGTQFLVGEPCCHSQTGFSDRNLTVARYGPDGALQDTVGSFPFDRLGYLEPELGYVGPPIFGATGAVIPLEHDLILHTSGRGSQIDVRDLAGELRRSIRWTGRPLRVEPRDGAEWRRITRQEYEERFPGVDPRVLEAQVGDGRPMADEFPSPEEIIASGDGRVWAKEYDRPFDEGPSRWLVFERDGAFACEVLLPTNFQVLEVGGDYLLARTTDDLGVEFLVERRVGVPTDRSTAPN